MKDDSKLRKLTKDEFKQYTKELTTRCRATMEIMKDPATIALLEHKHGIVREHDPELARLLRKVDLAVLEHIEELIRYLDRRNES